MAKRPNRRAGDLAPDLGLWRAIGEGPGLREILTRFYARVFDDPRLLPFFEHTTQGWVIDKQYSFLRELFTGEKIYFGDRPRNAHHWMVISDELFDYREELMREVMREAGIAPEWIARWGAYHEVFRKQIVKDRPVGLKRHGVELPLEGYDDVVLDVGSLCDGCEGPIERGQTARFHVRTGKTFCGICQPEKR